MKKITSVLLILSLCALLISGCGKEPHKKTLKKARVVSSNVQYDAKDADLTGAVIGSGKPDEIQIRNICQLATLEVYFHNVAKAVKPADTGIFAISQEDRKFWIEYSGSAQVGIDMSKVTMTTQGNHIKVRMPHATLIGEVSIDSSSYDINSVAVESQSAWRQENKITASDVTNAIRETNLYSKLS
ncbi:MAG: DUF4230 domain-containing protein, partial [Clostridiales bacterium]|nr:DUF4230 domain-containing protein [Clostridiales bacterium]